MCKSQVFFSFYEQATLLPSQLLQISKFSDPYFVKELKLWRQILVSGLLEFKVKSKNSKLILEIIRNFFSKLIFSANGTAPHGPTTQFQLSATIVGKILVMDIIIEQPVPFYNLKFFYSSPLSSKYLCSNSPAFSLYQFFV